MMGTVISRWTNGHTRGCIAFMGSNLYQPFSALTYTTFCSMQGLLRRLVIFFWGVQEPKSLTAFFAMLFMMDIMGIHHPFHIIALGLELDLDPSMDDDVMKHKVENTIA